MENSSLTPVYDSSKQANPALDELREILKYRHLVSQMVRRDIVTRYKRSFLGIAWTMLNPLATSIILVLVFSNVFGVSSPGYPVYILGGFIAWNFFSQTTNAAMVNLVWGGDLLRRIYIPRTIFAVSSIGTGLVNLALALVPLLAIVIVLGIPLTPALLFLPVSIICLALFSLGIGLFLSSLAIYFTDVAEMYQIILMAWFYLSPIIYTDELLPERLLALVKIFNPMYQLINMFRTPILLGQIPEISEILISGAWALVSILIGWMVFTRRADEFSYRV
ncbi:MAG: ABC transporter permease [Anaerolineales bacterium]